MGQIVVYLQNQPPPPPQYVLVPADQRKDTKHSSAAKQRAIRKELEKSITKASKAAEKMRQLTERIQNNAQL